MTMLHWSANSFFDRKLMFTASFGLVLMRLCMEYMNISVFHTDDKTDCFSGFCFDRTVSSLINCTCHSSLSRTVHMSQLSFKHKIKLTTSLGLFLISVHSLITFTCHTHSSRSHVKVGWQQVGWPLLWGWLRWNCLFVDCMYMSQLSFTQKKKLGLTMTWLKVYWLYMCSC